VEEEVDMRNITPKAMETSAPLLTPLDSPMPGISVQEGRG